MNQHLHSYTQSYITVSYTCTYVYIHIHTVYKDTYTYIHIHIDTHTRTCTSITTCKDTHTHIYIYMFILTSTQKYVESFGIHIVGLRPCPAMAMGCNFMLFSLLGMHNSLAQFLTWGFAAMALENGKGTSQDSLDMFETEFKPGQDALRSN